ncbi:MAG: NUDIX hydrolase [Egibacteraceae bacterium]
MTQIRLAVDVVVVTLEPQDGGDRRPITLAVRRDHDPFVGAWSLPGGAVRRDEDLEKAARRVLSESLGTAQPRHLEQLASFGAPDRDPRGRVVSVSYLALLPARVVPRPAARWWSVAAAPGLAFDHARILASAIERLRGKLSYSNVAYGLLPEEFTLSDLQAVYEAVLDRALDKRNFRKKVLSLGMLQEAEGQRRGSHRPAQLYRFAGHGLVLLDDVIAV